MKKIALAVATICWIAVVAPLQAQIDTSILKPVGYHPSNVAYFQTPYFSNAALYGGEWRDSSGGSFGDPIDFNAAPAQFIDGYPQFLTSGQTLRGLLYGVNIDDPNRPAGWPSRLAITKGHIVLTWQGNADVRLDGCTFISGAESNGAGSTGLVNNGRRSYLCSNGLSTFQVMAMQTPLTDLKVWLPAVDDPGTPAVNESQTTSLENQTFHPLLLQRLADKNWSFIRFMDWGSTNASPQKAWTERRKPGHIFQAGVISKRSPLDDGDIAFVDGPRETGVAYEHMIALCNAANKNLWINIPHLASADFITKLAQLIKFGSDASGNPALAGNPVFPPLNSNLKVYIEYSNEIWSNGFAFPQGNWAQAQADADSALVALEPSDTLARRARFNARRFCDVWRAFQSVFGDNTRLVRVAATFTSNDGYTNAFLSEIASYGTNVNNGAATRPDVLAITTYFGNGIQDFVNDQGFTAGKPFNDPYWTSPTFASHLTTAFNEWKRRILAGDAATGAGPDATGIGGGFDAAALRSIMDARLTYRLPIVAYEGGPSLFTDNIDSGGTSDDDGVTIFIEAMNRDARVADVYRIHLELAKSKGLWTHNPYVDSSQWGRFGQWGHLETLDQDPATQPKYALMKEHFDTFTTVRHADIAPTGTAPQWVAPSPDALVGIVGNAYSIDINTTAGDGARTVTIISTLLEAGLTATNPTASTLRISGTPTTSGKNFVFARVVDSDGDASWSIFTVQVFGGAGTLIQSDLQNETNPALNLPWSKTHVLSKVTWTGWSAGAGTTGVAGNDAIKFQLSGNADANGETLSQAIADNEFLTFTMTPATGPLDLRLAEFRFSVSRSDLHAPSGYAVFSSIDGFSEANSLGSLVYDDRFETSEAEKVLTLPNTAAYSAVNAAVTFRIVTFGGKFDGHAASLTAFKLTQSLPPCCTTNIPTNVVATSNAAASAVAVIWTAVEGATSYEIVRRATGGTETTFVSATNSFTDTTPSSNQAFLYRVRAVGSSGTSGDSARSLATTVAFTDDALVAQSTKIKSAHLTELRTAVEAVRSLAALTPTTYTDSVITAGSTQPRAIHISDLRTALSSALTTLGFTAPAYSSGLAAGSVVKQVHFQELRDLVR
ncbi:MAG TPA: hypothetical protein VJZ00_22300 [Thermoanaerobaculia bacterium]|nr:hypothetical protein [Thermoanaerobaculia bacterium]